MSALGVRVFPATFGPLCVLTLVEPFFFTGPSLLKNTVL